MMSDGMWHGFGVALDPIVDDLMSYYPGHRTQQRQMNVVMPGTSIPPHVDVQDPWWVVRIHVPLTTNEQTSFVCDDGPHFMQVGKAYRVNTEARHAVYNYGATPRVHFMFDVRKD